LATGVRGAGLADRAEQQSGKWRPSPRPENQQVRVVRGGDQSLDRIALGDQSAYRHLRHRRDLGDCLQQEFLVGLGKLVAVEGAWDGQERHLPGEHSGNLARVLGRICAVGRSASVSAGRPSLEPNRHPKNVSAWR
jgi:hypothetical protein